VFGAATSGRSAKIKGIEDMVGLFINTLPLRVQILPHETVVEFLQRIDNAMPAWKDHESVSPAHIRGLCDDIGDRNEELFDTIIALENYPLHLESQPGALITPGAYHMVETTHYDLTIGITVFDRIQISFIYNRTLLEAETVSRLAGHFKKIIETMTGNPQLGAAGIDIVSDAERKQLLFDFNSTGIGKAGEFHEFPVHKTIHHLFAEQVEKIPDRIAVVGAEKEEKKRRRMNNPTDWPGY
jgi:non-ribosomal peptide synthetase component F